MRTFAIIKDETVINIVVMPDEFTNCLEERVLHHNDLMVEYTSEIVHIGYKYIDSQFIPVEEPEPEQPSDSGEDNEEDNSI